MRLLKRKFHDFVKVFLIFCTLIQHSYQQNKITTNVLKKGLKFCTENHTMSNTLQTFWRDANAGCELESKSLINLYSQLLSQSQAEEKDYCSALLKHQVRKKLIQVISTQLEEALIIKSLETNRELRQNLKDLQELDITVAQIILGTAINEVYLFMEPEEIAYEIIHTKDEQTQFAGFEILLDKYFKSPKSYTLLPFLTCQFITLLKSKTFPLALKNDGKRLYLRLPHELPFLCTSHDQKIGLLNYKHFEYLYAPRDNGPDDEKRIALTWTKTKNSTDSDGHILVRFNNQSLVSFGSYFGSTLKFLYVNGMEPYFWIGSGVKSSRWWKILWPHVSYDNETSHYVLFRNKETGYLLCATLPYDENRRYVTLMDAEENMDNPACFWLVTKV